MPSSYTLGEHFETFVKELVATGRYASASEVIREGLRLLQERQEKLIWLRKEIEKGASGPFAPFDVDEIFGDLIKEGESDGRDAA